jgi:protein-S-isoprenylcysteine O-methyltransferase Ste14
VRDVVLSTVLGILFIGQVALCILFDNSAALDMLLCLGWTGLVVVTLIGWAARVAFQRRGGAHDGESWLQTRVVVESGIYVLVRHAMYVSFMSYVISLILISQYWLSAILGVPIIVLLYFFMRAEEQSSIRKLGKS